MVSAGVRWLQRGERLAWSAGLVMLAVWGAARMHGAMLSRQDLARFAAFRDHSAPATRPPDVAESASIRGVPDAVPVDTRLWSPQRLEAYRATLHHGDALPLAVLRIPSIGLEVPVLDGTDDWTLNRAVGRVPGTAWPNALGNFVIAGHRDGFFRGLEHVVPGDLLELTTVDSSATYRIETTRIVGPEDVEVLRPTERPSVTLITCYPFYFVGSAPQRYIVSAVRCAPDGAAGATSCG